VRSGQWRTRGVSTSGVGRLPEGGLNRGGLPVSPATIRSNRWGLRSLEAITCRRSDWWVIPIKSHSTKMLKQLSRSSVSEIVCVL
jgi:hypothetical protein